LYERIAKTISQGGHMSHYSVLVVGTNVEEQLAPYHEFECTGTDDQYVQDLDKTKEAREEYESRTETRYKDPKGDLHYPYGNRFYREFTDEERQKLSLGSDDRGPIGTGFGSGISWTSKDWGDGRGYRAKVHFLPEGWEEVEIPMPQVKSFPKFIEDWYGHRVVLFGEEPDLAKEHKYGYTLVDERGEVTKVVDRTNPNSKWDWYSLGGRWNGFFKLKPFAIGALGRRPASAGFDPSYKPPTADRADICAKGSIDIEGMRFEAGKEAGERYDTFLRITNGCSRHLSWEEVQKRNQTGEQDKTGEPAVNWDAARKEYNEQPAIKALRADKEACWFDADDFLCSREEYVADARKRAISTFAVIKDGQWYERGSMGWWGCVSNEKNRDEWVDQFSALIESLPDDTLVSVVDCHI
jgi:hypothetical protein